ncbi:uncharacterized protein BX663DRAFT_568749 [Cokeromyces recurvatus]|uniref:uncharacterized protein n=1 Tax=Cokeromyces recurvatus TaxID=90255 RepID=UPI00221FE594|nr:uncharacterized protein BX663DRAFT_568749 [Cokeromyces recurvatus]KAI7902844.1 hypothetical protein BX663DRAFT_568749 [Cokeromyces recurvatus]
MNKIQSEIETHSLLTEALYEHLQATIQLTKVALELEWTVFTRFIVGAMIATFFSIIYLVFTLRNSRRPLVIWEKLNKPLIKLFRPKIFAFLLGNMNPYSRSIDMRISTYSRGFCTGLMRDRQKNRNPFKSIHATALATFAETIGELGLSSCLKDDKEEISLISLDLQFKKKARGLLTASTEFKLPEENMKSNIKMNVVIKDGTLDTVAIASLVWIIESNQHVT